MNGEMRSHLLFSESIYDLIVTNGDKSSVIHLQKSSTIIEELRSTPIHDLSFIAFAMKLFDDAPTTSKIGASILVLITKKDAARKKQKEARIHMIGRQLADIAQHKCTCNPPCLEGNEYKAFMIKETENVGFEIVHPFSSQKMQEKDTDEKTQEDTGEKEHQTVPNEEDEISE